VQTVDEYLQVTGGEGGSDLHLKAGGPAYVRIDGDLKPSPAAAAVPEDTEKLAHEMMDARCSRVRGEAKEADFAYSIPGVGRFRVNAFRSADRSASSAAGAARPPDFESLGLPPAVRKLAEEHRGLVLVTGPTGSGKTTTTAAMISHINATRRCHIVTLEDPIEVMHRDDNAIIDQREIGVDTDRLRHGLKAVSRQDPDVIFIGEMRDLETVTAALQAAETGHLVISTLHTTDARETINRIVDMYPKEQQNQARLSLANSLKGIVCQRLVPAGDRRGPGRGRRGAGDDHPDLRVRHGPGAAAHDRGRHRRGRLLRHADLRPAPAALYERAARSPCATRWRPRPTRTTSAWRCVERGSPS
jgi:twitching motility protein PilT